MPVDADLLERLSEDRALASSVLFGHRHPQAECSAHIEIMDLFRSADELIQIEGFRQLGKTTKAEEALILGGCFRNFPYALLIGETYEKACQRLSTMEREIRGNEGLNHAFGGTPLIRRSIENKLWFASGAMIQAAGWEQELQSFKEGPHRPWIALLDDVENKESVRDSTAVDQSMRKMYLELMPALDKDHRKIINSQTRLAQDCMVTRLAANPEWVYRGYPICDRDCDDPDAIALWPERYPIEWIRQEKRRYRDAGMLDYFLLAYMIQATNPESKPFKREMLQEMDASPYHWMPRFAIFDPARTTNRTRTREQDKSDRTGKVVVSRMGSKILIHESSGQFQKPDELLLDLFATDDKHSPAKIAIEKNALDDWLLQPIRIEMLRRGHTLPLQALQAPQDRSKDEFIMGLQPFAHARDIVLIGGRGAHADLCAEWENFPQGSRDVLNALAYSLKMFGGAPMYDDFSASNIDEAPEPARGETVSVAFNADPTTVVAVAVLRQDRRLFVLADWSSAGPITDAVKTVVYNVRATFPTANIEAWAPADLHEQWQRVALVPSLKREKMSPYRGDHIGPARGCLSEKVRTKWHGKQLLMVDRHHAKLTLNALSAGYAMPVERGGRQGREPEAGISRLIGEALESMVSVLEGADLGSAGAPAGARLGTTSDGRQYISARPART